MSRITRLTESDLNRLVRKVIKEQTNISQMGLKPKDSNFFQTLSRMKNVRSRASQNQIYFKDVKGNLWLISKEWVFNKLESNDTPQFLDMSGSNTIDNPEFMKLFDNRRSY